MRKETYKYGMRLRGFGPGCQPDGVVCVDDGADYIGRYGRLYHSILTYDHPLTDNEVKEYELDRLSERSKDVQQNRNSKR